MKMEKINEYWNQIWKWTDRQWMVIKKWKYWEAFLVVFLVIILILTILYFNTISSYLFSSEDRNGELAKVILTVLGGIGVIYGLVLNSKRIKEQNRQNTISEKYNTDSRFNDAVKQLGSENKTLILGSVFTLSQIANEEFSSNDSKDIKYRPIISRLLISYLQNNCASIYKDFDLTKRSTYSDLKAPLVIQTIIDILMSDPFFSEDLRITNLVFRNIKFKNAKNCYFELVTFEDCHFSNDITNFRFILSSFNKCSFGSTTLGTLFNVKFIGCTFAEITFYSDTIDNLLLHTIHLDKLKFKCESIINSEINQCDLGEIEFIGVNSFKNTKLIKCTKSFKLTKCNNADELIVYN